MKWIATQLAHPSKLVVYNHGTVQKAEQQCGSMSSIPEFLAGESHSAHRGTEGTSYASLSQPIEWMQVESDIFLDHSFISDNNRRHLQEPEPKQQSTEWWHMNAPSERKL